MSEGIKWPDFTFRWLASGPDRPQGADQFYSAPNDLELEEVPDPWLIPAIDTRRPWTAPALAGMGGGAAYDRIVQSEGV